MPPFVKLSGLLKDQAAGSLSKGLSQFVGVIKALPADITGTGNFDNAQVCAGGVDGRELNPNLEAKRDRASILQEERLSMLTGFAADIIYNGPGLAVILPEAMPQKKCCGKIGRPQAASECREKRGEQREGRKRHPRMS